MARSSAAGVRSKEQISTESVRGSVQRSAPSSRNTQQKASAEQPETSVHPAEPSAETDDARKPGSSPAKRKVLQMNVKGGQAQQPGGTPAGQHATGSFTGGTEKQSRKRS